MMRVDCIFVSLILFKNDFVMLKHKWKQISNVVYVLTMNYFSYVSKIFINSDYSLTLSK